MVEIWFTSLDLFCFSRSQTQTEITFLDTKVYKGDRFHKESILDVQTHYKPMETFQYTNFYSFVSPTRHHKRLYFTKGEARRGFLKQILEDNI